MSTLKIEITFPAAVELSNDDQRQLDAITGEICDIQPWAPNREDFEDEF